MHDTDEDHTSEGTQYGPPEQEPPEGLDPRWILAPATHVARTGLLLLEDDLQHVNMDRLNLVGENRMTASYGEHESGRSSE